MKTLVPALLLSLIWTSFSVAQTQTYTIGEATINTFYNVGPILSPVSALQGYFSLLETYTSKGRTGYIFEILDPGLRVVLKKKMEWPSEVKIREVVIDDKGYIVKAFYHDRGFGHNILLRMDKQGSILFEEDIPHEAFKPIDDVYFNSYYRLSFKNKSLFVLDSIGTVGFSTCFREKKHTFLLHFLASSRDYKDWTYTHLSEDRACAEFVGVKNNTLYCLLYELPYYRTDEFLQTYVVGFDLKSGKMLFKNLVSADKLGIKPFGFQIGQPDGALKFTNFFYERGVHELLPSRSEEEKENGLIFAGVDKTKNLLDEQQIPWEEIKSQFPENVSLRGNRFSLHNITRTKEGHTFLVYESTTPIYRTKDLHIIQLNPDLKPVGGATFPRLQKQMKLYTSSVSGTPHPWVPPFSHTGDWMQDSYFKIMGFDYSFTVKDKNGNNPRIGYTIDNGSRRKKGLLVWVFGLVHCSGENIEHQTVEWRTKAKNAIPLPAKPGYLAVLEFWDRKDEIKLALIEVE